MKKIFSAFALAFLAFSVSVVPVFAQGSSAGKVVVLDKTAVVPENYYAAGSDVKVSGTVNGDVLVAGGNVDIDGTVKGDVLAAGGDVIVSGNVLGNVRAVGGQIKISGSVGKNISVAGGQVSIPTGAKVAGNVSVAGGELAIGTAIPGTLAFAGGQLTLGAGSQVKNISLYSQNDVNTGFGATISGQIQKHAPPRPAPKDIQAAKRSANAAANFFTVMSFISALAFGLIIASLFPSAANSVSSKMETRFWSRLGIGILSLLLLPVAFIILLITVVGIPFAFISVAVYALLFYFSKVFAAVFIGKLVARQLNWSTSLPLALLVGLVLYYLLGFIPVAGFIAKAILSLAAIGAMVWPSAPNASVAVPVVEPVAPISSPRRRLAKK